MVYPCFFRKWRYMVAAILNEKKCTRGISGASSEFDAYVLEPGHIVYLQFVQYI